MARRALFFFTTLTVALWAAAVVAEEPPPCELLPPDTIFVDLTGERVDLEQVDYIGLHEVDPGVVVVYRRTLADADELVKDLARDGERETGLLEPETWLVAAGGTCRMHANKCMGPCPGVQKCRRQKKPGKDVCLCVR